MYEVSFKKRIKQLFCKHRIVFIVGLTEFYQEPNGERYEKVLIHKCKRCHYIYTTKD